MNQVKTFKIVWMFVFKYLESQGVIIGCTFEKLGGIFNQSGPKPAL